MRLAPHLGLPLLSFAAIWSFSPLPDACTLAHYSRVFGGSSPYIKNTPVHEGAVDMPSQSGRELFEVGSQASLQPPRALHWLPA